MAHAPNNEPPLDEIVWRHPVLINQFFGGSLTPDTVLLYFRESPFFDRLSNNNSLWTQAQFNPSLQSLMHSREALEARLKTMTGLEFAVAIQAPESGLYVIRRQVRKGRRLPKYDLGERPDGTDGKIEDVRVEGVYFVIGDNIYMAPRIGGVLVARQLSIINHLRNALHKAAALSNFSPSTGHQFLPPVSSFSSSSATTTSATSSQATATTTTTTTAAAGASSTSSKTTVATAAATDSASSQAPSTQRQSQSTTATTATTAADRGRRIMPHQEIQELRTMPQSLQLSLKYAAEFLDAPPPAPTAAPQSQQQQSQTTLGGATPARRDVDSLIGTVGAGGMGAQVLRLASGKVAAGGQPSQGKQVPVGVPFGQTAGAGTTATAAPKKRRKSKAAGAAPTSPT